MPACCGAWRTTTSWRCRPAWTGPGRIRCPSRTSRRSCSGSCSTSPPTNGSPSAPRSPAILPACGGRCWRTRSSASGTWRSSWPRPCPTHWSRGESARPGTPAPAGRGRGELQDRRPADRRLRARAGPGPGPELRARPPRARRCDGRPRSAGAPGRGGGRVLGGAGAPRGRGVRAGGCRPAVRGGAAAGRVPAPGVGGARRGAERRLRPAARRDRPRLGDRRGVWSGDQRGGGGRGRHRRPVPRSGSDQWGLGGGYDVGFAALAAAVRAQDGRGRPTVLATAVPAYFGLPDPLAVTVALHLGALSEGRLVELPPLLFGAARQGDRAAAEVVLRLADEVSGLAVAAIRRLGASSGDPDVVLGGGLLRAGLPLLDDAVRAGIEREAPGATVVTVASDPI